MTDTDPNGDFVLTDHDWRSRASCGWDVSKLSIGRDLVVWHQLSLRQMSDDVVWKRWFQICQVVHLNFGSFVLVWFIFDAVQWCLVPFCALFWGWALQRKSFGLETKFLNRQSWQTDQLGGIWVDHVGLCEPASKILEESNTDASRY